MTFTRYWLCASVLSSGFTLAQTPSKFEVASIKPADPNAKSSYVMTDKVGGLNATNTSVRYLIMTAYGLRDFQLSGGPGWISSDLIDVKAKPEQAEDKPEPPDEKSMTDDQRAVRDALWKERIRALLTDRFGLMIHKEMKEQQIYHLMLSKGGSKLTEAATPEEKAGLRMDRGRAQGAATPMAMLIRSLSSSVGKPVVDMTGLTGKYDWKLEWTPDAAISAPGADAPPSVDGVAPTIFTAVQQQLGLKLETARGPVETWVIDRVEHPSEN